MIYQSDRTFQLWDYNVGHAQMLLRSPASIDDPFNIDLVFLGVDRMDIPTKFTGLALSRPEPMADARYSGSDLHRLTTGGQEYTVIAAAFRVYKNQLELMESSLEYFSKDDKDPGEVLTHTGLLRRSPEVAGQSSA